MSAPASSSSNRSRPGIFEWTGLQFLRPTPRRVPAELSVAERRPLDAPSHLSLPAVEDVPGDTASLNEIGAFIVRFDPARHFRERWGERYRVATEALWQECVSAYHGGRNPAVSGGELLLCLAYDWRLDPDLGVGEHEKLAFLRSLLEHLRLRSRVAETASVQRARAT